MAKVVRINVSVGYTEYANVGPFHSFGLFVHLPGNNDRDTPGYKASVTQHAGL
jgi:hypothetical protein